MRYRLTHGYEVYIRFFTRSNLDRWGEKNRKGTPKRSNIQILLRTSHSVLEHLPSFLPRLPKLPAASQRCWECGRFGHSGNISDVVVEGTVSWSETTNSSNRNSSLVGRPKKRKRPRSFLMRIPVGVVRVGYSYSVALARVPSVGWSGGGGGGGELISSKQLVFL